VANDQTLTSTLLIAMPQLEDPNFHRTVMLIVEHDENGTFGLVLNRTADLLASTLCASVDIKWRGHPDASIHWGGPVEPNSGWLLLNHPEIEDLADPAVTRVGEQDLFLARSIEILRNASTRSLADVRFYLGYAGWGPGQLEWEMSNGAWLVAPPNQEMVFGSTNDSMWEKSVRSLGIDPASLVSTQGIH
jgi:putative transcriptional regulator